MMKDIFNGIINEAMQNAAVDGEDYVGDDGLLYCHKCKTRKQYKLYVAAWDEEKVVPVMCECMKVEVEREEKERERREWELRIEKLKREGITDDEYLKWTFAQDDRANEKVSDVAHKYCDQWQSMRERNIGLLFYGPVGSGKSFMGAAIANAVIEKGHTVLMAPMAKLIRGITAFDDKISDKIMAVDLLVIDDLGAERGTSMALENLQTIIDTRYRSGKPLIATTNLSLEYLKNPDDIEYKRPYDRLLEMCVPVQVAGESRRAKKGKEKREEMIKLLGF